MCDTRRVGEYRSSCRACRSLLRGGLTRTQADSAARQAGGPARRWGRYARGLERGGPAGRWGNDRTDVALPRLGLGASSPVLEG